MGDLVGGDQRAWGKWEILDLSVLAIAKCGGMDVSVPAIAALTASDHLP